MIRTHVNRGDMSEGAYILTKIRALCHEEGECLVWDGCLNGDSPRVTLDGAHRPVRQVMYERAIGQRRFNHEVIHTCGTRNCVAPEHLEQIDRNERRRRTALSRYVSKHLGEDASLPTLTDDLLDMAADHAATTRAREKALESVSAARSGAIPNSVFAWGQGSAA